MTAPMREVDVSRRCLRACAMLIAILGPFTGFALAAEEASPPQTHWDKIVAEFDRERIGKMSQSWKLDYYLAEDSGLPLVRQYLTEHRAYPYKPTESVPPLPYGTLLQKLLDASRIKDLSAAGDPLFLVDSPEPKTFGVLDNTEVTTKWIHPLGTVRRKDYYFTLLCGEYATDVPLCSSPCCRFIFLCFRYRIRNGDVTEVFPAAGDVSPLLSSHAFLEERDINNDGTPEIFLHQPDILDLGESNTAWSGFEICRIADGHLRELASVTLVQDLLGYSRSTDEDYVGTFWVSEWDFLPQQKWDEYPPLRITRRQLYKRDKKPEELKIVETVFNFSSTTGRYELIFESTTPK